jgi:hypothetical protein
MELALDCLVEEVPDYGVDEFVRMWADSGITRIRPTVNFHAGRILSPANPRRRLLDLEGDRCFLDADSHTSFEGRIKPIFSERSVGVLGSIAEACRKSEIALDGWALFLFNRTLARAYPDVATQSALGCPDLVGLSPTHPDTHDYVIGLVRAAGKSGLFEELQVEGIYHVQFPGDPGDVTGVGAPLSSLDLWLVGVCFSKYSRELIGDCGGDGDRAAHSVRQHLDLRLSGEGPSLPKTVEGLGTVLGDDLEPLLRSRELAIHKLALAATEEAHRHDLKLEFEDDVASWESFSSGDATGPLATERHWEFGTQRQLMAEVFDEYLLLLYLSDLERIEAELNSCTGEIGFPPRVCMRPYLPDCKSTDDLLEKFELLARHDVRQVVLYMPAFMPALTPAWVRVAANSLP